MSYSNNVMLKCPHCDYAEDWGKLVYSPMAALSNFSVWRNDENEQLASNGKVKCDLCGRDFLYEFSVIPTLMTAKPPTFT